MDPIEEALGPLGVIRSRALAIQQIARLVVRGELDFSVLADAPQQSGSCVIDRDERDRCHGDHEIGVTVFHDMGRDIPEDDGQDRLLENIQQGRNDTRDDQRGKQKLVRRLYSPDSPVLSKNACTTSWFSSRAMVQVLYTNNPPGLTAAAPLLRMSSWSLGSSFNNSGVLRQRESGFRRSTPSPEQGASTNTRSAC